MRSVLRALLCGLLSLFCRQRDNAFRIAALEQQLAVYRQTTPRPKLRKTDRVFWVVLARLWRSWRSALVVVRPAIVIEWHTRGFRLFWTRKSRGRHAIEREHRELIRRLSKENPSWGEDRICDELRRKLGVDHAASTVRRYMLRPEERRPLRGRSQTWKTFLENHAKEIYACDFVTQWTAAFRVVYVFVVIELGSRKIVHVNVTGSPTLAWVKQQIREFCAFGRGPRFLLHDNDRIFGQLGARKRREDGFRSHLDRWLTSVMGIKGIATPHHAPNANSFCERFNGSLRREALDHFIFLSKGHVLRVVKEYVRRYNGARVHQGTNAIPDPYDDLREPPKTTGRVVAFPVLGGVHHDYRRAA